jgi:Inosine-uridine nucleoside N-ribohydrolase
LKIKKGESGLDGTDLLPKVYKPAIRDVNPILAMRDALLAQPKGTPWLVATGTLTNVALLFATFPEVAEHIQGLSIMGGAIGNGFTDAPMSRLPGEHARIGNVTPWAEFNIYVCIALELLSRLNLTSSPYSATPNLRSQSSATPSLHPRPLLLLWI